MDPLKRDRDPQGLGMGEFLPTAARMRDGDEEKLGVSRQGFGE